MILNLDIRYSEHFVVYLCLPRQMLSFLFTIHNFHHVSFDDKKFLQWIQYNKIHELHFNKLVYDVQVDPCEHCGANDFANGGSIFQ